SARCGIPRRRQPRQAALATLAAGQAPMHTRHAIILAAGLGSRLQAQEGHKLLAMVGGRTLLSHHLDNFKRLGVSHITVVTGYRHEALERAVEAACAGERL